MANDIIYSVYHAIAFAYLLPLKKQTDDYLILEHTDIVDDEENSDSLRLF